MNRLSKSAFPFNLNPVESTPVLELADRFLEILRVPIKIDRIKVEYLRG